MVLVSYWHCKLRSELKSHLSILPDALSNLVVAYLPELKGELVTEHTCQATIDTNFDIKEQKILEASIYGEQEAFHKVYGHSIPVQVLQSHGTFNILENDHAFCAISRGRSIYLCQKSCDRSPNQDSQIVTRGRYDLPAGFVSQLLHHDQQDHELLVVGFSRQAQDPPLILKLTYSPTPPRAPHDHDVDEEKKITSDGSAQPSSPWIPLLLKEEFKGLPVSVHTPAWQHRRFFKLAVCALDSHHLANVDSDGTIKIIELRTGQVIKRLKGHGRHIPVDRLLPASEGRLVSWSQRDHLIKIWRPKTGACLNIIRGGVNVGLLAVFNDILVCANRMSLIRVDVWSLKKADRLLSFDASLTRLHAMKFSSNGLLHLLGDQLGDVLMLWSDVEQCTVQQWQ